MTHDWWTEVLPNCSPHISPAVIAEIERGDPEAARHRTDVVEEMAILEATDEMADLAREYFEKIDIPDAARADSFHLAFATWQGMDFLVTWNCKHIASAKVRRIVETINAERGIRTPEICTPEELMDIWAWFKSR